MTSNNCCCQWRWQTDLALSGALVKLQNLRFDVQEAKDAHNVCMASMTAILKQM